jgi:uncharacterized protein YeaO (DUF488 family)
MTTHAIPETNVRLKRAYEAASSGDGVRVLVDRLWPRGVRKIDAAIDQWLKEIAPSTELRRWFGHDPGRWSEFRRRYVVELGQHVAVIDELRAMARSGVVTLIYGARDDEHNQAIVLRDTVLRYTDGSQRVESGPVTKEVAHARPHGSDRHA